MRLRVRADRHVQFVAFEEGEFDAHHTPDVLVCVRHLTAQYDEEVHVTVCVGVAAGVRAVIPQPGRRRACSGGRMRRAGPDGVGRGCEKSPAWSLTNDSNHSVAFGRRVLRSSYAPTRLFLHFVALALLADPAAWSPRGRAPCPWAPALRRIRHARLHQTKIGEGRLRRQARSLAHQFDAAVQGTSLRGGVRRDGAAFAVAYGVQPFGIDAALGEPAND